MNRFSAVLTGDGEVPAVSTDASGTLTIDVDEENERIEWELTYSGLQDDSTTGDDVTQARIHFGQPFAMRWDCLVVLQDDADDGPRRHADVPADRNRAPLGRLYAGIRHGPRNAADRRGADFDAVVAAIRKGFAYGNVHTVTTGSGEIRGQLKLQPGNGQN